MIQCVAMTLGHIGSISISYVESRSRLSGGWIEIENGILARPQSSFSLAIICTIVSTLVRTWCRMVVDMVNRLLTLPC